MEARSEIFKPLTVHRRMDFSTVLAGLLLNIGAGLQQNGVSIEDLSSRLEPLESLGSEEKPDTDEELDSFISDLEDIAGDGSLIADIEPE